MNQNIQVVKRNERGKEQLNLDKIHSMVNAACEDIAGVSASQVEMHSQLSLYDGISTDDIQKTLIRSASDLISLDYPNYQFVAARLLLFSIRKSIYGKIWDAWTFREQVEYGIKKEVYDPALLTYYTDEEFEHINCLIDHDRDLKFTYAGLRQVYDKYLVQDRTTGEVFESPQFMYMRIAATVFHDYPKETRLIYVKKYYDAISKHYINLPTPIMAGVGTPKRQYASCVLIDSDDNLPSIIASDGAITLYTSQRAGIGINAGRIRALGDKIRGGEIEHTGVIPFLQKFQASVRCCTQNGVRGGSATVHFPIWHKEIEDIIVLKNNKGTEDNRVRKLDYSILMSKLFYERFIRNEDIALFSPKDVPGLIDVFGLDGFDELYTKYESDSSIPRKTISMKKLFTDLVQERVETGRVYIMNIDHCNTHSSFKVPIRMSNLCVAPETKILTSNGHIEISSLENQEVNVWNGEQWSKVTVVKTSDNQELIKVTLSNGEIECTPYHKFYIASGKNYARDRGMMMKRAHELIPGDKIIKCAYPTIQGSKVLKDAYTLGMHTGDGSYHRGNPFITLYKHKKKVLESLNTINVREYEDRTVCTLDIPKDTKFKIPNCEYTIQSRIEWLAGYIDADGHINSNGIQIKSINRQFITDLKLMLQTLGVNANLTYNVSNGGKQFIKGVECNTQPAHRISINGFDYQQLLNLGLGNYLVNKDAVIPSDHRDSRQFNTVESVTYTGRFDKTYCFTEPDRGMGVFNGIITGNCQEITLPTTPIQSLDDPNGEISLCILSAVNLGKCKAGYYEIEELADLCVRSLDALIDYQDYPVIAAELATKARRSLGVGFIGVAHALAKHGYDYNDPNAATMMHEVTEMLQYYLLKASCQLAKEKGACSKFHETKYSDGILPIDTYKREVDSVHSAVLHCDWESLRKDILKYGLRNSTLTAQMPSESSSVVSNETNGIEPPRNFISAKKSKKGVLKQVVPQYTTLKNNYTLLWDMKDMTGYMNIVAVMQKFFDQSISSNESYNPLHYGEKGVPLKLIIGNILRAYSLGYKTHYYHNTYDTKGEEEDTTPTVSAADEILRDLLECDSSCDSCTI